VPTVRYSGIRTLILPNIQGQLDPLAGIDSATGHYFTRNCRSS